MQDIIIIIIIIIITIITIIIIIIIIINLQSVCIFNPLVYRVLQWYWNVIHRGIIMMKW